MSDEIHIPSKNELHEGLHDLIDALEAQLAEAKALLNQVQIYPTRDTHPVLGDIHFYRSAAVPPDFGNRRAALAKAEGREVQP